MINVYKKGPVESRENRLYTEEGEEEEEEERSLVPLM